MIVITKRDRAWFVLGQHVQLYQSVNNENKNPNKNVKIYSQSHSPTNPMREREMVEKEYWLECLTFMDSEEKCFI